VCVEPLNHPGYEMAFHFMFILFGYAYRGVRAGNIAFLLLARHGMRSIILILTSFFAGSLTLYFTVAYTPLAEAFGKSSLQNTCALIE
jgi:hypothetical protein